MREHFHSIQDIMAFIIMIVRAKGKANGSTLTWAYNLFVTWALDFLP